MMYALIWDEFTHIRYGDEYLCIYIKRQRDIRRIFKIATIVLSASGIFSALQSFKIPTVISLTVIGLVQVAISIENFIIHSEDDLDKLCTLRMLYYDHSNKLEKLWHSSALEEITEQQARDSLFLLREEAKKMEELDNKLNIRHYKKLMKSAEKRLQSYIKQYYNAG